MPTFNSPPSLPLNIIECSKQINNIINKPYMNAAFPAYQYTLNALTTAKINTGIPQNQAFVLSQIEVLSHLHDIMRNAQPLIENFIQQRISAGEIHNADQARKSIAGNLLQQFVAYNLAQNVVNGIITKPVIVTMSVQHIIDQYAAISVGNEIQKPDSDIIVYSNSPSTPILNISCKTSCRERAGQTYKWKLLCDLATCNCIHKNGNPNCPSTRYNLNYTPTKVIKMCFVTTDFYNELSQPQISGMFSFFDCSYVAKPFSSNTNVLPLHNIIQYISTCYILRRCYG